MEYAVDPNTQWKKTWNTVVLTAVIFSTFEVPFTSAFRPDFDGSDFDYLIDLIFYIDIGLSFFTGASIAPVFHCTLSDTNIPALTLPGVGGALRFRQGLRDCV